ncbi:hypothetical protein CsatA_021101 [Cannabis sativa]
MAKISLLISVLVCNIFLLVAKQATAQRPRYFYQFCQNSKGNYTLNSTYQANLNHLLTTLPTSQNDNGYGFYNLSYGKGSDQVYAVGLCRGDTTPDFCRSCLNNSTQVLKDICPNQKEVIGGYDSCLILRYSNRSMLGIPETTPRFCLFNTENVSSSNVEEHFDNLSTLLNGLKSEAASGGSLRKYATGNAKAPGFLTIYALVQCTPDLSEQQCINCLNNVYEQIPTCCSGKVGCRVIVPSCSVRYEKDLFYGSPNNAPPPSPEVTTGPTSNTINNATEGQKSSDKTRIIIAVVATIAGVALIIIFAVCLSLRKSKKKVQALKTYEPVDEIDSVESLQYNFETIKVATDQFSEDNKLGQGGFGAVYKGRLANGQDIAVKRLCRGSAQGDLEFKNETWRIWREQNTSKMVDPLMRVGSGSEVMRCIHIGLLCVQENIANRPTMNVIVLMLNSNSLSLPLPSEPAFFMRSNTGSHMSFGSDFNSRETTKSSNHSKSESINEASITEPFPR